MFDSEDAHRKSRLPLTVCWSDAKAGDFLKRHEQNCSEKQLGKRNFFREPSTYSQHLKHSEKKSKALEDATPLLLCYSGAGCPRSALVSGGLEPRLP